MTLNEALTIIAILTAPLVAVQVSLWLQKRKQKVEDLKNRKMWIFRVLMATRRDVLSKDHINALNLIDVDFHGKEQKFKDVVAAWKLYIDHLENKELLDGSKEAWGSKSQDLLHELLYKMSISLDYDFDIATIKKTSYSPQAFADEEERARILKDAFTSLLAGKLSLPVRLVSDNEEKANEFQELIRKYISGDVVLKVEVSKKEKEN